MAHRIIVRFDAADAEWLTRHSSLTDTGKSLLLAILEARSTGSEVTADALSRALRARWKRPHDAIALGMAELVDNGFIRIVHTVDRRAGSRSTAA